MIIDAADLGAAPGSVMEIDEEMLKQESFSTHRIPISVITRMIREECGVEILMIGIQPESMELGDRISIGVKHRADELVLCLTE